MLVELPLAWIAVINTLGIPLTHLIIAWGSTQLPQTWFRLPFSVNKVAKKRPTAIYEKIFLVRSWKHLLPDAAPWFNGFPKGSLESTEPSYLKTFIAETRRGELSHWVQILAISSFIVINPWQAKIIIVCYAILSNTPCIINLRYTRIRMLRVLSTELKK